MKQAKHNQLNRKSIIAILAVCFVMIIGIINPALAATTGAAVGDFALGSVGAAVSLVVGIIATLITTVIGLLITLFVSILVDVAKFSNIINVPTVIQGWVIVRDLCNMFFILILLIIAFATILRYEEYGAKKLLPKLLIMAVLINFSRTIFGLMIDFSQVVMLTFVNAFADNGAGQFISMFQTKFLLAIAQTNVTDTKNWSVTTWTTAAASIMGVIAAIMTLIVLVVFVAVLIMRIVMLWIYTILSPLVFLGFAVPGIAKHTAQIWTDFTKLLVTGPMLAFFLWLALTTASSSADTLGQGMLSSTDATCAGIGAMFCQPVFQKFLIVIGLLMGGLMVAQQAGGAVGKAASFGENWSKKGLKMGFNAARSGGDYAQRKFFNSERASKLGVRGIDLSPTRFYDRAKEGFKESKKESLDRLQESAGKTMEKGGYRGVLAAHSSNSFVKEGLKGFLGVKGLWDIKKGGIGKVEEARKAAAAENQVVAVLREIKTALVDHGNGTVDLDNSVLKEAIDKGSAYSKLTSAKQIGILKSIEGKDTEGVDSEIAARMASAKAHSERADRATIYNPAGDKALMGLINSEKKDISTTDEDKIAEDFMAVSSRGAEEWKRAAALFLKANEEGGYNTLLARAGYSSVDAGYTKEEAEKMKNGTTEQREEYKKRRGGNDFVRDYFIDKMGMDEQSAFALQAESANIAYSKKHLYGAKTVKLENGKFRQANKDEQREQILTEIKKGDQETFVRQVQRAGFGGHDATGEWQMSNTGKELIFNAWKGIQKEIKGQRWNKSAAESIGKKMEEVQGAFTQMVADYAEQKGMDLAAAETELVEAFGVYDSKNIKDFMKEAKEYTIKDKGIDVSALVEGTLKEKKPLEQPPEETV